MVGKRSAEDVEIDAGYQHISEAPSYNDPDGETLDVVDDDPVGEMRVEDVPAPDGGVHPDVDGQTTLPSNHLRIP